jgi:hypothetical protein
MESTRARTELPLPLRLVLSLGFVAVAVVAGVATFGDGGQARPSADTPVTSPATVPPDGRVDPMEAERVRPNPQAIDRHPQAFEPAEARASERGVVVRFWGGVSPCFVLAGYDVRETDTTVTITLESGRLRTPEPVACIELAKLYEVEIPLRTPLGDREIVDGSPD